ncbi:hypothetical protein K438DRAFT_684263 [Mycena galopus ATCC 62051]|nr:hypothetical protein K438DRAFT_684263 [Mycena galopus ATCC 62051]
MPCPPRCSTSAQRRVACTLRSTFHDCIGAQEAHPRCGPPIPARAFSPPLRGATSVRGCPCEEVRTGMCLQGYPCEVRAGRCMQGDVYRDVPTGMSVRGGACGEIRAGKCPRGDACRDVRAGGYVWGDVYRDVPAGMSVQGGACMRVRGDACGEMCAGKCAWGDACTDVRAGRCVRGDACGEMPAGRCMQGDACGEMRAERCVRGCACGDLCGADLSLQDSVGIVKVHVLYNTGARCDVRAPCTVCAADILLLHALPHALQCRDVWWVAAHVQAPAYMCGVICVVVNLRRSPCTDMCVSATMSL